MVVFDLFFDLDVAAAVEASSLGVVAGISASLMMGIMGSSSFNGVDTLTGVAAPDLITGDAAPLLAGLLCRFHKLVTDLFIAVSSCAGLILVALVFKIVPGGKYSVNHDSVFFSLTKAYSAEASSSPDPELLNAQIISFR